MTVKKGSHGGECFTPGCENKAQWICIDEAPHIEVPQTRYRCPPCCALIALAVPRRPDGAHLGTPEWDEWRGKLDEIFAMTLDELKACDGPH